MPATTTFSLPGLPRLLAAPKQGFAASVKFAQADAMARRKNTSKSGVKSRVLTDAAALLIGTGLQPMFEQGRQGGYEINPSGVTGVRRSYSRTKGTSFGVKGGTGDKFALKFTGGDGGFAAYAVGGPMRAYPAMAPAARDWVNGGYQKVARTTMLSQGFGIR